MIKKKNITISILFIFVFVFVVVVVAITIIITITSCKKHSKITTPIQTKNINYTYLYKTDYIKTGAEDLSIQDLKQIHKSIASIYQVRSELQRDWKNREQYTLNKSLFVNKYLLKEITMYLYECIRFLSPEKEQYIGSGSLPYIENITINTENIFKKNNLYLIPVRVDWWDYQDDEHLEKDIYEQFFVFKKVDSQFLIANFISGSISKKSKEINNKITEYTQKDWKKNFYNRENIIKGEEGKNRNKYLDFIQGDIPKKEYIEQIKKQN